MEAIIETTAAQTLLATTPLNWTVRETAIQTVDGIIIEDKKAIIRNDNNKILGVHGAGYVPFQNEELMELLFKVSDETGLKVHSSGMFNDGGKVWVQLKSNDLILPYKVNGENDKVKGYLSAVNSFDGSTALAFGHHNKTISCKNSFWKAYREMGDKIRHSANMRIKIEDVIQKAFSVLEEEKQTFEEIIKLCENPMTKVAEELVKQLLFEYSKTDKIADLSTRKKNQIERFEIDLAGEIKEKGDSMWGLFSGVTKYTTHSVKQDNSENKMFGKTGKLERRIYSELLALV